MMIVPQFIENPVGYPIYAALFLQCTNRTTSSFMVDSFSVQTQSKSGVWMAMPPLPEMGQLYIPTSPIKGNKIHMQDGSFSLAAKNKNVSPGETIQGWVFLSSPRDGFTRVFRMRIKDTLGHEFVSPIALPANEKALDSQAQSTIMHIDETGVDISYFPVRLFSPEEGTDVAKKQWNLAVKSPKSFSFGTIRMKTAIILAGNNMFTADSDAEGNMAPMDILEICSVRLVKANALISAQVTDGRATAKMQDNQMVIFPYRWDLNQDDMGVEIVNERQQPVFQMLSHGQENYTIRGMFLTAPNRPVCIDDEEIASGGPPTNVLARVANLRPIFKYPSATFSGIRANGQSAAK